MVPLSLRWCHPENPHATPDENGDLIEGCRELDDSRAIDRHAGVEQHPPARRHPHLHATCEGRLRVAARRDGRDDDALAEDVLIRMVEGGVERGPLVIERADGRGPSLKGDARGGVKVGQQLEA